MRDLFVVAWLGFPCCVLSACGNAKAPDADIVPTLLGEWVAIDLHVHSSLGSNDAGEESTVAGIVEMARSRGLGLVAITDHSNSAGSMDCETGDVEDCPNQGPEFPSSQEADALSLLDLSIITGVEISPVASLDMSLDPRGHIGCTPEAGNSFSGLTSPVIDRPLGEVRGGAGVDWCHEVGGWAVVNHPVTLAAWMAYDWTSDAYDALEVFNGSAGFDEGDVRSLDAWMCDWAQGRTVVPVGGSDCHRVDTPFPPEGLLDQALGSPTTWVLAESPARDHVLAALHDGKVVISDRRSKLTLVVWDQNTTVTSGQVLSTAQREVDVRVSATTEIPGMLLQILEVSAETCPNDTRFTDGTAPTATPVILSSQALPVDTPLDYHTRFAVDGERLLFARLWPDTERILFADGVALTNMVRIQGVQ